MKKINLIIGLLAGLLTSTANATTIAGVDIAAFADSAVASNNTFYGPASSTPLTSAQVTANLTDTNPATYVLSTDAAAYVDIGFTGSNLIYNGAGADLALFVVGSFNPNDPNDPQYFDYLSIEINNIVATYRPLPTPEPYVATDFAGTYNMTVAMIELDDFNLAGSINALDTFRIFLGDATRPALSLVGGIHTTAPVAAVPLPIPALLLVSGLGLLGVFGRVRTRS